MTKVLRYDTGRYSVASQLGGACFLSRLRRGQMRFCCSFRYENMKEKTDKRRISEIFRIRDATSYNVLLFEIARRL